MFVYYEEAGYLDDQFLHGLLHYVCYVIMNVCMYITLKQVFKFIAAS